MALLMIEVKRSLDSKDRGLIVFDVEGVVLPKRRYLLREVLRWLDIRGFLLTMTLGFLYEIGVISLESALRRIYKLFEGLSLDKFFKTFREIPLVPGALEVFRTLKEEGHRIAFLSSGLPTLFVENLAERLGVDYVFGLDLEVVDGRLTGEISGEIMKPHGKAVVLKKLLNDKGFVPSNCTIVADDRNNLPMLPLCSKSIGYNSDFLFSLRCNYVVKGTLPEIIPYIESTLKKIGKSLSNDELFREVIHAGSFLIPAVCKYLKVNAYLIGILITLVTIVYVASEFARLKGTRFPLFYKITSKAAVGEEGWSFATSPYFSP